MPEKKADAPAHGLELQFEGREDAEPSNAVLRTPPLVIGAASVLVLGAIGAAIWFSQTGGPQSAAPLTEEVPLPTALKLAPSPARPALLSALDSLDALAMRAQRQLLEDHDSDPHALDQMLSSLMDIDNNVTAAKKDLNAEERKVAGAILRVARQLHAFISSYKAKLPDLDGTYARVARERIADARKLLAGDQAHP
jgi:hypothetical protein